MSEAAGIFCTNEPKHGILKQDAKYSHAREVFWLEPEENGEKLQFILLEGLGGGGVVVVSDLLNSFPTIFSKSIEESKTRITRLAPLNACDKAWIVLSIHNFLTTLISNGPLLACGPQVL